MVAISCCFIFIQSCTKKTFSKQGVLRPLGMTTFQYGTHYFGGDTTIDLALKSNLDLTSFEFYNVAITGRYLKGYPVDGGPDFFEILTIEKIK